MNVRFVGLVVVVVLALGGCNGGGDGGTDAGVDAGSALPPGTMQTADDVTLGLAVATALAAPLAPDGAMLRSDAAPSDATTHMRSEHGFSGSSVVTPATCATYAWTGLSATVTLAGCTLEALGTPVSGSVTLAVTLRPTTFTVTVDALTVGTASFTGHVTLTINGTDLMPAPPSLDVDLTYTLGGVTKQVTATGLVVTTTSTSLSITGAATLVSGGVTTSVAIAGLTWQTGDCLPSSGAVTLATGSGPLITLTFLTATPTSGAVDVQVGSFPPTTQVLFTAC